MLSWYSHHFPPGEGRYSRLLLGVLFVLFMLGALFGQHATNLFALTPGLTLSNYYLWTFVTAGLYDNSFAMGLINICVYVAVAPMLERSWGGYTFLKFIGVTNLCIMVSIFFSMIACYAATEYEPCLFRAVCGFSGINAAFAVALKQRFGERSCVPGVKFVEMIKFKHLPMFLGCVSLFLWLTGRLGGKESPLIFFGTFFAWLYLRFFMRDCDSGMVGDLRPEFSLATFFPDVFGVRPIVDFAGTIVFQTMFRFGLFQETVKSNASLPTTAETSALNPSLSASNAALAGSDLYRTVDPTAERRRLLAIKAIDDKLAELARQPTHTISSNAPPSSSQHGQANASLEPTNHTISATPPHADANVALPSDEDIAKMEAALAEPVATTKV